MSKLRHRFIKNGLRAQRRVVLAPFCRRMDGFQRKIGREIGVTVLRDEFREILLAVAHRVAVDRGY